MNTVQYEKSVTRFNRKSKFRLAVYTTAFSCGSCEPEARGHVPDDRNVFQRYKYNTESAVYDNVGHNIYTEQTYGIYL